MGDTTQTSGLTNLPTTVPTTVVPVQTFHQPHGHTDKTKILPEQT